ncbi:type IV pilus twitching motility protein PilT [Candidatus Dojkabacteria bacterium]|nr:type IV pilus twitching motility protein PilT [Candidatus Dojkabacteria bacterium]
MFTPTTPIPGQSGQVIQNPLSVVNPVGDLKHRLSPNTTDIYSYLDLTEQKNASDLHFTVGYPPAIRVDAQLQFIGTEALNQTRAEELFRQITTKEQFEKYIKERELDFSFNSRSGNRFRVNYYWDRGYMAAAFRLIPGRIKSVEELGLPSILYEFAKYPHGLILLTGPTGSGKSTTIAAMLNEINMNQSKHIITVEDPIEYIYPRGKSIINQREVEKDTLSWTRALKYSLREDPDVVLVGEMRDFETIAAAITVSETGHLVFATLHTNSAAQTIDRIIDVFPAHQQAQIRSQLANVLVTVISQRLIPLSRGGRKAAVEILIGSSAVKNAIRENKTYQIDNIIQTSAEVGMIPLEKSLAAMVKSGDITLDTALEYTSKPDQLKDLLR